MGSEPPYTTQIELGEGRPTGENPDAIVRKRSMVVGQAGTGVNRCPATEWRDQWLGRQETGIFVPFLHLLCPHPDAAPAGCCVLTMTMAYFYVGRQAGAAAERSSLTSAEDSSVIQAGKPNPAPEHVRARFSEDRGI